MTHDALTRTGLTAAALAAACLLSACGTGGAPAAGGAAPEPDSAPAQGGSSEGGASGEVPAALDFTAATVDGGEIEGAELNGEPAVLWFWAPWCTVCRGEADEVAAAARRHADDVRFIGVAGLGETSRMQTFVEDTGMGELTHIVDADGAIWSGFEVTGQPSFSFLRPDGTFLTRSGSLGAEELDGYIADELGG
ncbi:redoxin domain-containing protein [Streptomonospora litoralis]|uniref:Soluble secreted antigen MPT53 n=1 Tax=Streptomonospora litoralis TaxID=2498135 RepID=A0A4P6Q1R8_9ACTN|nr:redoxin domain-containing protein [Streptomonospora litoralis]QBI54443.1 Soluble secreted antigen MPT53 precursor [Streptomonospora litoralis]